MEKNISLPQSIYKINSFTSRRCFAKSNTFRLKEFLKKIKKTDISTLHKNKIHLLTLFNVCNSLSHLSKDMSKIPKRIQSYKNTTRFCFYFSAYIYDWLKK